MPLIYEICKKLPKKETDNLIGQMKRAGLSVSNHPAEGASQRSKAEKNRFFEVSRSSVVEIHNCLVNCVGLKFIAPDDLKELNSALLEEFKLITDLIASNNP